MLSVPVFLSCPSTLPSLPPAPRRLPSQAQAVCASQRTCGSRRAGGHFLQPADQVRRDAFGCWLGGKTSRLQPVPAGVAACGPVAPRLPCVLAACGLVVPRLLCGLAAGSACCVLLVAAFCCFASSSACHLAALLQGRAAFPPRPSPLPLAAPHASPSARHPRGGGGSQQPAPRLLRVRHLSTGALGRY